MCCMHIAYHWWFLNWLGGLIIYCLSFSYNTIEICICQWHHAYTFICDMSTDYLDYLPFINHLICHYINRQSQLACIHLHCWFLNWLVGLIIDFLSFSYNTLEISICHWHAYTYMATLVICQLISRTIYQVLLIWFITTVISSCHYHAYTFIGDFLTD